MFLHAYVFNSPLEAWDVSQVTTMEHMFYGARAFNQPLAAWNVGRVTSMSRLFYDAAAMTGCNLLAVGTSTCPKHAIQASFEAQVGSVWTTHYEYSLKQDLRDALMEWADDQAAAQARFGDISSWNVSGVTDMQQLVRALHSFNADINAWDVGQVTNMH